MPSSASACGATDSVSVTGLAEPEQIDVADVTSEILPILGTPPLLGRWFSAADDSPGARLSLVLLYPYWRARFGGDRSVLGRQIVVDGQSAEIIGVMPGNFRFLDLHPSLIRPLRLDRNKVIVGNFSYRGLARLKPGVTPAQAVADLARLVPVRIETGGLYNGTKHATAGRAPRILCLQPRGSTTANSSKSSKSLVLYV